MYDIGQVIEACAEASRQHLCNYRGCLHIYKVKGSIEPNTATYTNAFARPKAREAPIFS